MEKKQMQESRPWKDEMLVLLRQMQSMIGEGKTFRLTEVYYYCEPTLRNTHPKNKNTGPKIRQTLQVLRNEGLIEFLGNGTYRLVSKEKREMNHQ